MLLQATPNTLKAHVVLEEAGAKYNVHVIDLGKNEQKDPSFLRVNPNGSHLIALACLNGDLPHLQNVLPAGRIPAMVDHSAGDQRVFESLSIALYIAKKFPDSGLLPKVRGLQGCLLSLVYGDLKLGGHVQDPAQEADVISWCAWQQGGQARALLAAGSCAALLPAVSVWACMQGPMMVQLHAAVLAPASGQHLTCTCCAGPGRPLCEVRLRCRSCTRFTSAADHAAGAGSLLRR